MYSMFISADFSIASFCLGMVWEADRNPLILPSTLGAPNAPSLGRRCLQIKPQKSVILLVREDGLANSTLSAQCLLLSGTKTLPISLWLLQSSWSDCAVKQQLAHQLLREMNLLKSGSNSFLRKKIRKLALTSFCGGWIKHKWRDKSWDKMAHPDSRGEMFYGR